MEHWIENSKTIKIRISYNYHLIMFRHSSIDKPKIIQYFQSWPKFFSLRFQMREWCIYVTIIISSNIFQEFNIYFQDLYTFMIQFDKLYSTISRYHQLVHKWIFGWLRIGEGSCYQFKNSKNYIQLFFDSISSFIMKCLMGYKLAKKIVIISKIYRSYMWISWI